ncbi:MAG: hypothetical protein KGO02_20740 [Alphaproteobacteria bacterium]|nr:hypothetical protein [Alphaproteobacteria bacterium]
MSEPTPAYLKCTACGWCHAATPPGMPAGDRCFRCKGLVFAEVPAEEVPRGVTVQALTWPPLSRPPTITKERLTAADIESPGRAPK